MPATSNAQKEPLISFVIAYYEVPVEMLLECLDSIYALDLTDEEREVILIDDGSDVSPLIELMPYRDRLVYLRQPNQGLSGARNTGISLCRGRYIQFVDADDRLIKANYDHCIDMLRQHDPDVVMFRFTHSDDDVDSPYLFDGPMTGVHYMHHHNLRASSCGYAFRRAMLMSLRFTPGLLHEDEEFTPQLILRAETLYTTDVAAYYYRERQGSIVRNHSSEWTNRRLDDAEYVIRQLNHLAASLHGAESLALQRRVAQLTMDYVYNIIMLTRSEEQLNERIARLEQQGLFPLPERDYSAKYRLFRRVSKSKLGRKLLLRTLPLNVLSSVRG